MGKRKSATDEEVTDQVAEFGEGDDLLIVVSDCDLDAISQAVRDSPARRVVEVTIATPISRAMHKASTVIVTIDEEWVRRAARRQAVGGSPVVVSWKPHPSGMSLWTCEEIPPTFGLAELRDYITKRLAESETHQGLSVDVRVDDAKWLKGAFLTLLTESKRIAARSDLERRALKNEIWRLAAQRVLNAGMDAYVNENDTLAQGLRALASGINESCDAVDRLGDPK